MGNRKNINFDKFPRQASFLEKEVLVCFHYDTSNTIHAVCVRDDAEEPFVTIFKLDDGRYVLATECQYRDV